MGLTVGDLAGMSHLGITVLAGRDGLDRDVEWAHVCELEDPTPWLDGAGLVLTTGLAIPRGAQRQRAYLTRLAGHHMAGVAIAQGMSAPTLTPQLLAAADDLGFPVIEVAYEVPYLAITSVVNAATRERSHLRLLSYLRIFDTLRLAASQGLSPPQLFGRLAEVSAYRLHLCSPSGRPLLAGVPGAPAGWRPPASGTGVRPHDPGLISVPVPLRGRIAGYLVAVEQPGREALGLLAVRHIATIAALELANLQRSREAMRREGAETLGEMLAGMLDPGAVRARLRLAGLDPGQPLILAAVVNDLGQDTDLHSRLVDSDLPHLLLQQRELYVLLQQPPGAPDFLAATPGSHVGVSRPFRARKSLSVARREALWALRYARSQRRSLIDFSAMQRSATWLPADPRTMAGIVDEVVGPLAAHDAEHGTELVPSLRVLLEQDRNVTAAARSLGVHRNTVLHRIGQIQALTGRDLRKVQDLAELWLAISAQDILTPGPGTGG
ncbi:MAG TPA: PucR family transcriptional regulator ligand-binding domain-containing protein [Streptosporangiaceae bacterium]